MAATALHTPLRRAFSAVTRGAHLTRPLSSAAAARDILVLDGDGVGKEIVEAAQSVVDCASPLLERPVNWIKMPHYGYDDGKPGVTDAHIDAFEDIQLLLKGPITIPKGKGHVDIRGTRFTSANQAMRKTFGLYANVRPAKNFKLPWPTRFDDVDIDMIIVRENTEDLYCGKPEVWVDDDTCEATKRITRGASARIGKYASELAKKRGDARGSPCTLTAVHKNNVVKQTDGLFLEEVQKAAAVAGVTCDDALVDSLCAGLVLRPEKYDVLVAPNCWGDIISDLAGGLVGSLGLLGSANIGEKHALFEASHGSAPDIAGQGIVNPISMILSASMMLRHIGENTAAVAIEKAISEALEEGCATTDLGGKATTADFVNDIVSRITAI